MGGNKSPVIKTIATIVVALGVATVLAGVIWIFTRPRADVWGGVTHGFAGFSLIFFAFVAIQLYSYTHK